MSKSDVRHWCELLGDPDPDYCEKIKRGEKTVPPPMLLAWTMPPLWPPKDEAREPHEKLAKIFDEAGYSHFQRVAETPFNIVYEARA